MDSFVGGGNVASLDLLQLNVTGGGLQCLGEIFFYRFQRVIGHPLVDKMSHIITLLIFKRGDLKHIGKTGVVECFIVEMNTKKIALLFKGIPQLFTQRGYIRKAG